MLAALVLLLAQPLPASILNPGFERGLEGWTAAGHRGFRATVGSNYPAAGRHWLHLGWAARNRSPDDAAFQVSTMIDARRYRGRRIRLSAEISVGRSRDSGSAILFAETEGAGAHAILAQNDDWRRQDVVLDVPRRARTIALGFRIANAGPSIDADNVRLEILR